MAASPQEQDAMLAQFASIVGISPSDARQYLEANSWNLDGAVAEYYTSQEENADGDYAPSDDDEQPTSANPQPIPVSSSSSAQAKTKPIIQKKFATLGDFNSGNGGDDDSDDDENDKKRNLFAGGEKSGLAVQDPTAAEAIKRKIIQQAKATQKPVEKEEKPKKSFFTGAAQTLGGDDAPSRVISPPTQPGSQAAERVNRTLHFWEDGFSVDDGDLFRSDDPANASILNGIRQGRAPLSIMNVRPGQEVDVEIQQHSEKYVKPKKQYKAFEGEGNRLGSPTPGDTIMPGSFTTEKPATKPAVATAASDPKPEIDDSQPTVTLRVSMGNGTRMTARFNTTNTMGDVYDFVRRAETSQRPFVLQTTFPSKEMIDETQVLGDIPEFKRGGAVVQKYSG